MTEAKRTLRDVLPEVGEVNPAQHEAPIEIVRRNLRRVLGEGVEVGFIWDKDEQKLSTLQQFGIKVLQWADLPRDKIREVEQIVPFKGPGDAVKFADTFVVVGRKGAFESRERYRAAQRSAAARRQADTISAARLSREIGLPVVDRPVSDQF